MFNTGLTFQAYPRVNNIVTTDYHLPYVKNIPVSVTSARFFIICTQTQSNLWEENIKTLISQEAISDCHKAQLIGEGQGGGNFS